MRRMIGFFSLFGLFIFSFCFSQDKMEIPIKFDMTSNDLYQFQIPLTLGMPVDFGIGFNDVVPAGYVYVFSEDKRTKMIFFAQRTVEIKRIKVMWGLSEEFLFEFRFQHVYNDSFNIYNLVKWMGVTSPVANIPLTFTYDFRTFGSAHNPVLNTFGLGYTNVGPVEVNVFFQAYRDRQRHNGLTEIGIKLFDLRPFGICMGDLLGVYSVIDFKELNTRFKPRIAAGYSRRADSISFALLLHSDSPITSHSNLNLNTLLILPVSGEPYWSFQGQYDLSNQFSVIFNCSLEGFFLENKYIFNLNDLFAHAQ
ncbi:MAG TPA: hypothetical protein P5107_02955 [Thermotogota bacterium]|nr:hypothetical protein [Thermotogota bacterium]HRW33996.1 hypothetical protein [Thermotogota bacterium]